MLYEMLRGSLCYVRVDVVNVVDLDVVRLVDVGGVGFSVLRVLILGYEEVTGMDVTC